MSIILSIPVWKTDYSHFCLLFCVGGICGFPLLLSDGVQFLISFYCGLLQLLPKRDVICFLSDHQLSMLLQFSEEESKTKQVYNRKRNVHIRNKYNTVYVKRAITTEPICLLWVEKGCRTPDAHCAIVWGRCHEAWDGRVPTHTVNCARMACELSNRKFTTSMPDVHFVVWER